MNKNINIRTKAVSSQKLRAYLEALSPKPSSPGGRGTGEGGCPEGIAKIGRTVLVIGFLFFLSACNGQDVPPEPTVIRKKIVMNPETPPAPENKKTTDTEVTSAPPAADSPVAAYDPKGKIDPFIPFFEYQQQGSQSGNKKRSHSLTPLERLDLNQLKLVGIIRSAVGNKAIVEEASGKGYIVSKDTLIGINSGKVLEILTDRIIVQEEVENLIGVVKIMNKELILQRPPGEF